MVCKPSELKGGSFSIKPILRDTSIIIGLSLMKLLIYNTASDYDDGDMTSTVISMSSEANQ